VAKGGERAKGREKARKGEGWRFPAHPKGATPQEGLQHKPHHETAHSPQSAPVVAA
jgi:hypothetical protein